MKHQSEELSQKVNRKLKKNWKKNIKRSRSLKYTEQHLKHTSPKTRNKNVPCRRNLPELKKL